MSIQFSCTQCGQEYSVGPKNAGKLIRCQSCQSQVRIPDLQVASPAVTAQPTGFASETQNSTPSASTHLDPNAKRTSIESEGRVPSSSLSEMLIRNLTYQRSASISDIQNDLEQLRSFDKFHEMKESKFLKMMSIFIVLTIVAGLGTVFLMANELVVFGVTCALMAIAFLVISILTWTKYSRHSRLNLEDSYYELMYEFLRLIEVDARESDLFHVKLDFGKNDRKDTHTKSGTVGYWDVEFFANEWFVASGKLKDGSKFAATIKEKQQNRSRWKRSVSGKMKHKTKTKNAEEICLVIRPKEKRYPDLQKLVPDAPKALQIPKHAELKSFTFQQDAIVLKVAIRGNCLWRSNDNINVKVKERVNLLAMLMLSVFQVLNLSRQLSKSAG